VDGGYYQSKDERKSLVFKVFCLLVIIVLGMEESRDMLFVDKMKYCENKRYWKK